jgi:hypothetical protein
VQDPIAEAILAGEVGPDGLARVEWDEKDGFTVRATTGNIQPPEAG